MVLVLLMATVPLGILDHSPVSSGSGSLVLAPAFGVVGFAVAWRRPATRSAGSCSARWASWCSAARPEPTRWLDYRLRHGGLPLGWVAVLLQPGWAPAIALFGLSRAAVPGRPAASARAGGGCCGPTWPWPPLWIAGTVIISGWAIAGHHVQVDSGGNLLAIDHPTGCGGLVGSGAGLFFPLLGAVLAGVRWRARC